MGFLNTLLCHKLCKKSRYTAHGNEHHVTTFMTFLQFGRVFLEVLGEVEAWSHSSLGPLPETREFEQYLSYPCTTSGQQML